MFSSKSKLLFRQLFDHESSTYTYILADSETREAIIIDPVIEQLDRDLQLITELHLQLEYILETHIHADHITAAYELKQQTGAKIGAAENAGVGGSDFAIKDGDFVRFGRHRLQCIFTPGHTDLSFSYYIDGLVFTGDCLLIRGCGRTDFQSGSSEELFHSVREKLFNLPAETIVFPAHDYKGRLASSIKEEQEFNPRLGLHRSLDEFKDIMNKLNLPPPKKIDSAVPANMKCGRT